MQQRFTSRYRGKRCLFGYPASSNLDDQAGIWRLILPEDIGVQRNEGMMTEPEDDPAVEIPITDVFDLHTFQRRDIKAAVEAYLEEVRERGFRYVRIIHGRGIGVQRETVRKILARTPFVESFSDAPAEAGGWGATIVTLRLR